MKFKLFKIIICLILPMYCRSQSSASFGNNGSDITSMNLSTGTMAINIPFFSYVNSGVDLSVGIGYETSGILVNRLSSAAGLGWELYSGGHIKREIRGKYEDEKMEGAANSFGSWNAPNTNVKDMENDIFYLTIGKRNMKFIFTYTGNCVVIPMNNIKVERFATISSGTFPVTGAILGSGTPLTTCTLSFVVTDEAGNKFYFEKSSWNEQNVISDWSLTKVITFENDQITYTYMPGVYNEEKDHSSQVWQEKNHNYGARIISNANKIKIYYNYLTAVSYPNNTVVNFNYNYNRCDLDGNNSVPNPITDLGALDNITVSEKNWTYSSSGGGAPMQYSYKFNYSYFVSPGFRWNLANPWDYISWNASGPLNNYAPYTPTPIGSCPSGSYTRFRLKLDEITFTGTGGGNKPLYKFEYSKVPLPERDFGGFDKYGYSNGALPMRYNSPGMPPISGASPICDTAYMYFPMHNMNFYSGSGAITVGMDQSIGLLGYISACLITKITNSLGGSLQINYNSINNLGLNTGGVAVTSLIKNDGILPENDIITEYTYTNGEMNINDGNPIYYNVNTRDYHPCSSLTTVYSWLNFEKNCQALNQTINGPRYCFKVVKEDSKNSLSQILNRKLYKFSSVSTNSNGINNSVYTPSYAGWSTFGNMPFTNKQYLREWSLNVLIGAESYDNNLKIVSSSDYDYQVVTNYETDPSFINTRGLTYPYSNLDDYVVDNISDTYSPFTGTIVLTKKTDKLYYSNSLYVQKVIDFTYDNTHFYCPKKEIYTNSIGEVITTNYYYSHDFSPSLTPVLSLLSSKNISKLLYVDKWKLEGGSNKLLALSISGLSIVPTTSNSIRPNYNYVLLPSTSYITGSYTPNIAGMANGVSIPNFELLGAVTKYDNQGYIIEKSDMSGFGSKTYFSNVVDTRTGNIVAAVSNSKYSEMAYCGFDCDYTASPYSKGNADFNISAIAANHHLLGRLSYHCTSSTPIKTITTLLTGKEYIVSAWVLNGGNIVVDNGSSVIIPWTVENTYKVPSTGEVWNLYKGKFTYSGSTGTINIKGDGYIDEFRLYPSDAMMLTNNFLPILGKTAEVDPNDNITTYEYDATGTLFLTRDHNANIINKYITVTQGH